MTVRRNSFTFVVAIAGILAIGMLCLLVARPATAEPRNLQIDLAELPLWAKVDDGFEAQLWVDTANPRSVRLWVTGWQWDDDNLTEFGADYEFKGKVTKTSVKANLGKFGRINLKLHPVGKKRPGFKWTCTKKRGTRHDVRVTGSVKFRGERGYTRINRTNTNPAKGGWWGEVTIGAKDKPNCLDSRPATRPEDGLVEMYAQRGNVAIAASRFSLPDHGGTIAAVMGEYVDKAKVTRLASMSYAPRASFTYGSGLETARLEPGPPFKGFATLNNLTGDWTGNLRIQFPGRPVLPLAGDGFAAVIGPMGTVIPADGLIYGYDDFGYTEYWPGNWE